MAGFLSPLLGAPGQQSMFGNSSVTGSTANATMANVSHLVIREKMKVPEILFGYEQPNVYNIETKSSPGFPIIVATEKSDFLMRQCCPDGARAYHINLRVNAGGVPQPYLYFTKSLFLTCACFCRPKLDILDRHGGNRIGIITNPFSCCRMKYIVHDGDANPLFEVSGCDVQIGMLFRSPCGMCRDVNFSVTDCRTGANIAHIKKTWGGMARDWVSDSGLYELEFYSQTLKPQDKGLLLAVVIMLSEEYFTRGGATARNDGAIENLLG